MGVGRRLAEDDPIEKNNLIVSIYNDCYHNSSFISEAIIHLLLVFIRITVN
jgi:hypothetical protein